MFSLVNTSYYTSKRSAKPANIMAPVPCRLAPHFNKNPSPKDAPVLSTANCQIRSEQFISSLLIALPALDQLQKHFLEEQHIIFGKEHVRVMRSWIKQASESKVKEVNWLSVSTGKTATCVQKPWIRSRDGISTLAADFTKPRGRAVPTASLHALWYRQPALVEDSLSCCKGRHDYISLFSQVVPARCRKKDQLQVLGQLLAVNSVAQQVASRQMAKQWIGVPTVMPEGKVVPLARKESEKVCMKMESELRRNHLPQSGWESAILIVSNAWCDS